jgi:hypothetical protein
MDVSLRIMNQIEVSTTLTLVRFLSKHLQSILNPLDTIILAVVIFLVTLIVAKDYILGDLSRRLSVLLILEKIRPLLLSHIDNGEIIKVHGLFINAGFLSLVSLIPSSLKQKKEVSILLQAFIYMYSNVLWYLTLDKSLQVTILALSLFAKFVFGSIHEQHNKTFKTLLEIGGIVSTYLSFSIIQNTLHNDSHTQILQLLLIFLLFQFTHNSNLNEIQDFLIYTFAMLLISFITSDQWYWTGVLFLIYYLLSWILTVENSFVQILLIMISNLVVTNILNYIKFLATHDSIITLKTSAIVIQFIVHEFTNKITVVQTK